MFMRRLRISLVVVALLSSGVFYAARAQQSRFVPVTDAILQDSEPADWLSWRRDNGASGYSPLDQVTRANVQGLRLAWAWAMESGKQESEPIVYRGVMYLPHTRGVVQALDARTGEFIWEYRRNLPEGMGADTTRNLVIYGTRSFSRPRMATLLRSMR